MDRRQALALPGLIMLNGRHVTPTATGAAAQKTLDDVNDELATLAARYESNPPAQTVAAAWSLASRAGLSAGRAPVRLRPDWTAAAARALVLEANAALDTGDLVGAARTARTAAAAAKAIWDGPTVAHAYAVLAEVHATQRRWDLAADIAHGARKHAGAAPVTVMLAGSEAIARAELDDHDRARAAIADGERLMAMVPVEAYGGVGYSLDAYHPAQWAASAARALVRLGDIPAALPYLDELRDRADGAGAVGLSVYARLLDARAFMTAGQLDGVRAHLDDAITVARDADRKTGWLAEAATRLAQDAEKRDVALWDLAGKARV